MQDKTAKVLRQATSLLDRDLYPKDRARILEQGCELVGAAKSTLGGRPAVSLTFSDGSTIHLSAQQTGGTMFRNGRPLAPKITPVREAVPLVTAPAAVATPRERRDRRTSSPTRAGPGDDPDEPEPPSRRLCALCSRDIPAERATQARYCSDRHAERDRKRRTRARNRERSVKVSILRQLLVDRTNNLEPGELVPLLEDATCACNGRHILDVDPKLGKRCVRCGRQRPDSDLGKSLLQQLAAAREAVGA
jgi:hypothetical protein